MGKLKSKKAVTKRIRLSAKGKVLALGPGRRHLLSGKSSKRKRQMRRKRVIGGAMGKRIARLAGGG